ELPGPLEELRRVALEHLLLVGAVLDEVRQALLDAAEGHRARDDVLPEVGVDRLPVRLELDPPVGVVEVEQRVEGVVVELRGLAQLCHADISDRCCQNCPNPSLTRSTSCVVPSSSNRYRHGTCSFAEMMSPAMQKADPKFVFPAAMTARHNDRLCGSLRNLMTCLGTAPRPLPPP